MENSTKSKIKRLIRECIMEIINEDRMITEKKKSKGGDKKLKKGFKGANGKFIPFKKNKVSNDPARTHVLKLLNQDDMLNHAELARKLWHPSNQKEEDTARSLFSKKATGKPDADGKRRSFSDDEISKLSTIINAH